MDKLENNNLPYNGFKMEDLEEILEDLANSTYKGRQFKILTGCTTAGWTDLELENLCTDPECTSCSSFRKLLLKEINKNNEEDL